MEGKDDAMPPICYHLIALSHRLAEREKRVASLLIRNVDEALRDQLKLRARRHRRSLEEEARELLRAAMARDVAESETLSVIAERLFGSVYGVELVLPPRAAEQERGPLFGRAER
jgi:plasmid stability protein